MSGEAGMDLRSGTGLSVSNPGLGLARVYGSGAWDWFVSMDTGAGTGL